MRGTLISKTWEWTPELYAPPRYRRACRYEAFLPDPVKGIDFTLAAGVAGAISEAGHDKIRCQQYMNDLGYPSSTINGYNNETSVAGCGLCQTGVPCEDRNPLAKRNSNIRALNPKA